MGDCREVEWSRVNLIRSSDNVSSAIHPIRIHSGSWIETRQIRTPAITGHSR